MDFFFFFSKNLEKNVVVFILNFMFNRVVVNYILKEVFEEVE